MPPSSASPISPRYTGRLALSAVRSQASHVRRSIHTLHDTPISTFVSHYKAIFSRHAAPLAVITASYGVQARAATVSSLTSLSVSSPGAPLVTFNLRVPSSTSKLMHDAGRFSVNLLSGVYGAEEIARGFAGPAGTSAQQNKDEDIQHIQEGDQVEILDVDWFPRSPQPYNTPMLNHTTIHAHDHKLDCNINDAHHHPVAFARLDCRTQRCFTVRDHEIWVGEVERIEFDKELQEIGNDVSPDSAEISPALVYFSRTFKRVVHGSEQSQDSLSLRKYHLRHRIRY
ncbi:flavin reductase like domain-containing protein [Lipomyces chichibuensis]|uniref:flavin reductase like domain-containing protein n=1 Tax=Lipomyces chichibuensis TaxID=1546026 RepID=UPI00334435F1